jgi:hypothetical protein
MNEQTMILLINNIFECYSDINIVGISNDLVRVNNMFIAIQYIINK